MNNHQLLLKAIKERSEKKTEHWHGISTADRYVKTVQDCVGLDACYKFACHKGNGTSFADVLTKAASKLAYANEEMKVEDLYTKKSSVLQEYKGIELPKDTLMVFKHVLTSNRKDRDGDVLHPMGADLDPKMLMLFNHIHTLPIGKLLVLDSRNRKQITVVSALVDMNELAHDCAKMIANDMGRYSHGFRAIEFNKMKETDGMTSGQPGFEVTKYEVMEESLVSVPANKDAETQEIILDLVESKKLKSGLMKEYGRQIREKMPAHSTGFTLEDEDTDDEFKSTDGGTKTEGECGCGGKGGETCRCASKETDDNPDEGKQGTTENKEMSGTKMLAEQIEGSFEYIRWKLSQGLRELFNLGEKEYAWLVASFSDRVIVSKDTGIGTTPKYYEVTWKMDGEEPVFTSEPAEVEVKTSTVIQRRSPKARRKRFEKAMRERFSPTVKTAMAFIASEASLEELDRFTDILDGVKTVAAKHKTAETFRSLTGGS